MKRGEIKTNRVMASKPSQNKLFRELTEEFIRQAEIKNLSEWTIKSYTYHTQYFIDFAGHELMCKEISMEYLIKKL
ncbi:hypothetical protein E9840_05565 [Tissierella creatinini]|nr:hypothetical protein E9840_05565 [Tissierella creatinini]TJX65295.1 hypothetical protein E8P77_10580 [Soehngenia saccharolytica]